MRLITNIDQIHSAEELQTIIFNTKLEVFARKELAAIGEHYPQPIPSDALRPDQDQDWRNGILRYLIKD